MPKDPRIKKVLVIGSGPIIIGQAAEFDYSGTQACRALKSEGVETVLVNSNPATIMTDPDIADHVYIEPLTAEVIERIIEKEKPDAILPNLGGQMGLNLSMELARSGFLDRSGVRLLACKPDTIDRAEDRQLFKDTMEKLHQPIIPSKVVEDLDDALDFAEVIGYPVIVRPAFTMGGTGGGICEDREKLHEIATNGLRLSPIHQILVEKCISGWKEIEYEVMRDSKGNVITVCNMENLDPVGIHTGDSIVVAPSQTLSDKEYQMLRTAALDIITELGIEGGCNCQFALKPDSFEYAVIEVNPRVSRSSALASKATGYPIAKVATKIALGYTLDEITNDVTGETCACFEPALDYVVVKYPKWPFDKFVYADKSLGTQMMATGEVMSIGNSFEAAMMKAVSSIELGMDTLTHKPFEELTDDEIVAHLHVQDAERVFCVYEALKRGIDHQTIYRITKIDWWFLDKMQHLADLEKGLAKCNGVLTEEQYKIAEETAESYHKTYQLFLLRFNHGNVSEMEVAQAWSQWESAMVQIPQIRQNRTELKNSLSILTGVPVEDFPKPKALDELDVPDVVAGIPSQLLEERPDVIQAEEQLKAANADIGAAKALYFPSISLSGGLGFSSDQLRELFKGPSKVWQYAGNISGPIFHWGAVTAGVRSAEAQQKALSVSSLNSLCRCG